MTTLAIIGAGKGLGAAVARRFGQEGFAVGLISRHQGRLDALAAELEQDGVQAKGFTADVRDPASIAAALEQVTETLGPIEVLQYSPLPQKDFMRPVLETTPEDLGPRRVLDLRSRSPPCTRSCPACVSSSVAARRRASSSSTVARR